jgi:hypothetical protein
MWQGLGQRPGGRTERVHGRSGTIAIEGADAHGRTPRALSGAGGGDAVARAGIDALLRRLLLVLGGFVFGRLLLLIQGFFVVVGLV